MKQELKHEPVSTRVKLKILPHLLRSRLAAECFPANIQVGLLSILYAQSVFLVYYKHSKAEARQNIFSAQVCVREFHSFLSFFHRLCMMVCLELALTTNCCLSPCSLFITSVWCKKLALFF